MNIADRIWERPKTILFPPACMHRHIFPRLVISLALYGLIITSAFLIFTSCSKNKSPRYQEKLTSDESYLIDTYIKIIKAENLHQSDSLRAENLFAAIDSTLDSLRIANAISSLNEKPDRWVHIFRILNEKLKEETDN